MEAVRTIRRELGGSVPLIGFSGSPWTLATYMVEGGSSRDFAQVKTMAYDRPQLMHALLALLADAEYGTQLTAALFADDAIKTRFSEARAIAARNPGLVRGGSGDL